MSDGDIRERSRARIRAERDGDPHWVEMGGGRFALHIQYSGQAVIVDVGAGRGDADAFREWLAYRWESAGDRLSPIIVSQGDEP